MHVSKERRDQQRKGVLISRRGDVKRKGGADTSFRTLDLEAHSSKRINPLSELY